MKKFIRSVFRPQKRRGKFILASVLSLIAAAVGISISPDMVYPSLRQSNDSSNDGSASVDIRVITNGVHENEQLRFEFSHGSK